MAWDLLPAGLSDPRSVNARTVSLKVSSEGLDDRLIMPGIAEGWNDYRQRLQFELEVINQMGLPVTLIVMEFIAGRKNSIL